jgi:hypothetical protein
MKLRWESQRQPRAHKYKTGPYLVWVSVVVVVTGAGTVVCSVVVDEVWVALSVPQPVNDKSGAMTTQRRMIFFMLVMVV